MTLAVNGLTVALGGVAVLREVTATLEPGAITAICGPNGAGKSTLLAALAGLIEPACGEVSLDGKSLAALPRR
ncbi:MAG TPA: ATP-binding cassette domain-containing protein, partial [Croceibacterium sp.]|nr:ATP-binding cassette domain-containing protein [Croceibacterium sp.]